MKKLFLILVIIVIALYGVNKYQKSKVDDPWTNSDGSQIVCRRIGCGKKPVYPDWNRRYCEEHIKGEHSCRYPNCFNKIPNSSEDVYCEEHKE